MRTFSRLIASTLLLALPTGVFAGMRAQDALQTPGEDVVTRGEFIRAAVLTLDMENLQVDQRKDLPYRRVAKGYEPFVRVAHRKNALESFGFDLLLSQGITRGQALRVLVNLTGLDTPRPASFKDVEIGTPDERAVRVAIARSWMEPLRNDLFGVRRKLTGDEARLLLRKVAGEQGIDDGSFERSTPTIKVNYQTNKRIGNLPKTQILEAIWSTIEQSYLRTEDIDVDEAAWAAAEGMVNSLGDKYTTFMRPVKAKAFQERIKGEITGIGAQVEYIDEVLTIVSPIKGSPAEAAGVKPGDQVIRVNGEDLAGLSFMEAVEKVRGPKGSKASLVIRRNGLELNIDVIRDVIRVPELSLAWQGQTAVVEISQFGEITHNELRPMVTELMQRDPKGIVLDLRNNPGGLLSSANTVTSIFMPMGTPYVKIMSRRSEDIGVTTLKQIVPDEVPLVILVNEGSASASEIVAGALQDHERATIIGSKTFGKGTVQQVLQFLDSSSLKLTIAEWFTPNGHPIDGHGINPDIGISEIDGRDAPLLRAIDVLR